MGDYTTQRRGRPRRKQFENQADQDRFLKLAQMFYSKGVNAPEQLAEIVQDNRDLDDKAVFRIGMT